jgi:hypothetical protein
LEAGIAEARIVAAMVSIKQFIQRINGGDIGESLWINEPIVTNNTRLMVQVS